MLKQREKGIHGVSLLQTRPFHSVDTSNVHSIIKNTTDHITVHCTMYNIQQTSDTQVNEI